MAAMAVSTESELFQLCTNDLESVVQCTVANPQNQSARYRRAVERGCTSQGSRAWRRIRTGHPRFRGRATYRAWCRPHPEAGGPI